LKQGNKRRRDSTTAATEASGALAQAKLDAFRHVAGRTAHQFNNILGGLMGYANLMADKPDHQKCPLVEALRNHAEPCVRLTQRFMRFALRGEKAVELVRPTELLDDVLGLLEKDLRAAQIEVVRQYGDVLPCQLRAEDIQFALLALVQHGLRSAASASQVRISINSEERRVSIALEWPSPTCAPQADDSHWTLASDILAALDGKLTAEPCPNGVRHVMDLPIASV